VPPCLVFQILGASVSILLWIYVTGKGRTERTKVLRCATSLGADLQAATVCLAVRLVVRPVVCLARRVVGCCCCSSLNGWNRFVLLFCAHRARAL